MREQKRSRTKKNAKNSWGGVTIRFLASVRRPLLRRPQASRELFAPRFELSLRDRTGSLVGMNETSCAETLRAFVALPVSEEVNAKLHALQQWLRRETGGKFVRWVRAEQFHLTLRFFGTMPMSQLPALKAALQRAVANQPAMDLTAARTGRFGTPREPKVIWAGVGGELTALRTLQARIAQETFKFGQRPDDKIFEPHLTLGRVSGCSREESRRLAEVMAAKADIKLGAWRAEMIQLIRSEVTTAGATYTELAQFAFAPASPSSSSNDPATSAC